MKFWQLVSICRECRDGLENVLRQAEWEDYLKAYMMFDHLVENQLREILDQLVPEALVTDALEQSQGMLYVADGFLRLRPHTEHDEETTFLGAYRQYGAAKLEEALEYGLVKLR